ncbi:MAG: hypothetical protein D8M59_15020 [Planctomycetes bacterium]|nr:hypothetical protein [Planctomycetota bacterium]NOG52838.1 hypothetical protein [Planctomycetota bacterium]
MGVGRSISPLLITAGPTHEPLDAVRYIGNRSSGRLGVALALAALQRGITTTLLLGPTCHDSVSLSRQMHDSAESGAACALRRFTTTADLEAVLADEWPGAYACLIMAAAVADYRLPAHTRDVDKPVSKLRRSDEGLHLDLEATPDLVAACAQRKQGGQTVVAFALEDEVGLAEAAREKMQRKGVDGIVANPLGTMEARSMQASLLWADGTECASGEMDKAVFAGWLIDRLLA